MIKKDFEILLDFYSEEDFDNMLSLDKSSQLIMRNTCYDVDVILTRMTEEKASGHIGKIGCKDNNMNNLDKLSSNSKYNNINNNNNNSHGYKGNNMNTDLLSDHTDDINLSDELKKCESLNALRLLVDKIDTCVIKKFAKNTVFSDGNENAKYMLIGEAPGEQEDITGTPFCGKSGKLLRSMLKEAGFHDDEVYFSNILFWRPPANRTPTYEEINVCMPFIEKHIQLLNPEIIILVGNTAASSLLSSKLGITMLRKKVHQYKNDFLTSSIKSVAIFHPSYILRNIGKRADTVQELVRIRALCH